MNELKSATHKKTRKPTDRKLWTTSKEGNTSDRYHNKSHKHTVKDKRQKTTNSEKKENHTKTGTKGAQTTDDRTEGRKHRRKRAMEHKHKHSLLVINIIFKMSWEKVFEK